MPTLSVCLIVKNEERHLARCLESVHGLAAEIVVVDTGSTDRTIEIAQAHGACVRHFTWQDDFSAAKNFSIEQATGDWILSLDADESLAARDHDAIRAFLGREDLHAVVVPHRHYLTSETTLVGWRPGPGGYAEGEPYPGYLDEDCRRLFRNLPWLRFRNRVHEELASTDPARPLVETRATWVVHHFGKAEGRARLRAKGEAYLRIGRAKIEEHPRDPQAHYELGVQYAELEQPQAAIPCFERALALTSGFRDAQLRLALCQIETGQYKAALAVLRLCARTLPEQALDIALAEGNAHRELGDPEAAERAFRRALMKNPAFAPASVNLALLCTSQGRLADALACLDRAVEELPSHVELRALRAHVRHDSGDEAGALADAEAVPTDPRACRLRARILVRQRRFSEARDCLTALSDDGDADVSALRGAIALGLGELDQAVTHLRRSVEMRATPEAALNLSIALEARSDRGGALAAVAEALRVAPSHDVALARFAQLAGDRFTRRAAPESHPLTIHFHQPYSISYDGTTPRTRGLGGTESAVVYLAEALARRGHRCVVFNNCEQAGSIQGVEYARWETSIPRCVSDTPDVVVGVRFWETIGRLRLAPLQIFWTGDAFDQPFVERLSDASARREIDLFMLQSDWQEETFATRHHVPRSRIVRTRLGAAASMAPQPLERRSDDRPRRLAYASTPFRGLDLLLDLFPRIRSACPDAELHVFSSMQVYGVSEAEDRKQFDALYRKARQQPGVTLVGSLPQMELATRLQECRVLAYPNHFAETFCIAAAEAQAAGCAVVTSTLGALPETVGDGGICIPGDPRSGAYHQAFVNACVSLLTDDDRWQAMSDLALARAAAKYSWPLIAEGWEAICRAALTAETSELERIAVHLANGRAGLAQRMLARTERPSQMPEDAWQSLGAFVAWRAGGSTPPDHETLQRVALHFPSLRRAGIVDAACQPLPVL